MQLSLQVNVANSPGVGTATTALSDAAGDAQGQPSCGVAFAALLDGMPQQQLASGKTSTNDAGIQRVQAGQHRTPSRLQKLGNEASVPTNAQSYGAPVPVLLTTVTPQLLSSNQATQADVSDDSLPANDAATESTDAVQHKATILKPDVINVDVTLVASAPSSIDGFRADAISSVLQRYGTVSSSREDIPWSGSGQASTKTTNADMTSARPQHGASAFDLLHQATSMGSAHVSQDAVSIANPASASQQSAADPGSQNEAAKSDSAQSFSESFSARESSAGFQQSPKVTNLTSQATAVSSVQFSAEMSSLDVMSLNSPQSLMTLGVPDEVLRSGAGGTSAAPALTQPQADAPKPVTVSAIKRQATQTTGHAPDLKPSEAGVIADPRGSLPVPEKDKVSTPTKQAGVLQFRADARQQDVNGEGTPSDLLAAPQRTTEGVSDTNLLGQPAVPAAGTGTDAGSVASQTQGDSEYSGDTSDKRSPRETARAGVTTPEGGTRFGLGGWVSAPQPHTGSTPLQLSSDQGLVASHGMTQMSLDRVASESSTRRLNEAVRSDMSFGVQTEAFGRVDIQTSLKGDQLVSQISLEHAHLHAAALTMHMPVLESKLVDKFNLNASVTVRSDAGGAANTNQSPQQQQNRGSQGAIVHDLSARPFRVGASATAFVERSSSHGSSVPMSQQLDITV